MVFDAAYNFFSGAVGTPSRHMVMCGRTVWHLPIGPKKARGEEGNHVSQTLQHIVRQTESNTLAAVFNELLPTPCGHASGNSYEKANHNLQPK